MIAKDIEAAKRSWVRLCEEDDLGLWWIARDIRELMPGASETDVRHETLAALRPLLSIGALRAADQLEDGDFEAWEGSVDEQLARIESEWIVLGRPPDLGDIVWFIGARRWKH